jgi:hypothetical protein
MTTSPLRGGLSGNFVRAPMRDQPTRLMAFFAVVIALLNSGYHYHNGHIFAAVYFMAAAVLVTSVTEIGARRRVF